MLALKKPQKNSTLVLEAKNHVNRCGKIRSKMGIKRDEISAEKD